MKRLICVYIALMLALSAHSATYKIFEGKQVSSQSGLVGLYETDGKLYMEVPRTLLGKRLLTGTMVEACSDMLESNVGYQPIAPYVVSFEEVQGQLLLNKVNDSYASNEGGGNMDISNINTVERMFEIKEFSADSSAFLIDVSSYFLRNDKSMDPIDPKAFNAAQGYVKRTGSFIPKTTLLRGFTSGDGFFSVSVSNSYKVKAAFLGVFSAEEQPVVTSVVRRSFILLPETSMLPVEYDVKVGTSSVSLEDYNQNKLKSSTKVYATKWRLESGKDGVVKNPICFYIDPSFPDSWRNSVAECVEQWNTAFEKVGIKGALETRLYASDDQGVIPSDIRYNFIRYNLSPSENIVDSKWCDPATGEILGAGIVVNHGVAELIKKNLLMQVSAGCPECRTMELDSTLFSKALKSMIMRNLGHCLGLSDNMAGSHAYPVDSLSKADFTSKYGISTSVMDELPFNFIAYSSSQVEKGTAMMQENVGVYDLYALSRLYNGKFDDSEYFFGKRQKVTDFYDPRSMSFDLGDDAVMSVTKGMEGLAAVLREMNSWISGEDPDYNFRTGLQEVVVLQAYEYIKQIFVNVGGIYVSPKASDDNHNTYVSVPKDVQRRHLKWALECIDDLAFLDNEALKEDSPLRGDTGEFCQKYFTNFIFIQIDAMWLSEVKSDLPYTQEEALADVAQHIWKGAKRGKEPTDLQKFQRNLYVDNLLSWSGVRGNYYFREASTKRELSRPDKTHIWYGVLLDTKKLLEKASRMATSPEAKNHYDYLLFKIRQFI